MAVASTDYLQEVDAASTPKMAPTTPMQVWQKPQQPRESINAFPSLILGGRSELKGLMPARLGLATMSTPSKPQGRIWLDKNQKEEPHQDENLGSFCLSKYEKKYQTLGMASHMYHHMGPLSLHTVDEHAGHSNTTPRKRMAQDLSPGLEKLQEESPTHTQVPAEKKVLGTPTSGTGDTGASDPAILFSQTPGEVALDAYELYSKMFPSTCTAAAEHLSLPTDPDLRQYPGSPFLDHMNNMQLLQSVSYSHKPLVRDRCEHDDDLLESKKKIKFAKVKEEDTPGGGPTNEDTKPFRMPPENMSTVLCAPNSGKVVHSGGCAGHASVEPTRMSTQPVVGLKLYTSTVCMQMPKALPIVTAREPSIPLSSEPSALRATSKTPMQGGSSTDADWGRYLALSATPARSGAEIAIMRPFQERFKELQAFLKQCDEGDQNDSIQALRTLSGAARSGYAVELETRAIRLSLEEGKEMKRMRLLNVLGRISEGNLDTAGATPHGPRLPAPGAASTPKHVL